MSPARKALFLVALFVLSTIHLPNTEAPISEIEDDIFEGFTVATVSYTHLTLPTIE